METDWPRLANLHLCRRTKRTYGPYRCNAVVATTRCGPRYPQRARKSRAVSSGSPRRQFTVARAALRTLLSRYLNIPATVIILTEDANGKPRLARQRGSTPLHFNVAHSDELALVAMTLRCEVGVDVERLRTVGHWEEIASRYFHEAESRTILKLLHHDRAAGFSEMLDRQGGRAQGLGPGTAWSARSFSSAH